MSQFISSYPLNRTEHVWYDQRCGSFKCVLCGAVTTVPSKVDAGSADPERYEPLTPTERDLTPKEA